MSEPEKIGKYQILERIGRGGMGTIFKAHDPILNRPVALKVISTDIDVTDEVRARFFREAQACARLSHPNIVTVYDMGEDGGRLFIVMELLDGVELRRLIADRAPLALEEKLSIMSQVCDGLFYAHQRGIVHRDIKPGNIMRLRSGQVKILDFGIAQMESVQETLTRTGLIMGTLRYMAPEQIRGRADHRTDIFAVGAVCYEFLSLRPPFSGNDALELLEQLRADDPPALHLLDPTIPPEISDIVARAMRKDPAERVPDLAQMRMQIEQVQRALADEARRVSDRIRAQRDQIRRLEADLAARVGSANEEATVILDTPRYLAALQALEVDLGARIKSVQELIERADAVAPQFERGSELLQAGQFVDAIAEFEGIVADMPEHARATDSLARARAQVDAERRRQLTTKLVGDARAAVAAGEYTLGLEILKQTAEIPPPAEAVPEIVTLRATAETAVAAHQASPRFRQQAEDARAQMTHARQTARSQADVEDAPALWREAEAKSAGAEAAFAQAAYADAGPAFDAAIAAYRRFQDAAQEGRRQAHDAAEQARERAAQGRQRAQDAQAPQDAREQWDAAEATFAAAQSAFAHDTPARAAEIFTEASAAYGRAEAIARELRQRRHRQTEANVAPVAEARARPIAAGAPPHGRDPQDRAEPAGAVNRDVRRVRAEGPEGVAIGSERVGDVPPAARGSQGIPRARWILAGLGGLAAIAIVVSYSLSPRVPSGSPGKPPATTSAAPSAPSAPPGGAGVGADPPGRLQSHGGEPARVSADRPLPEQSATASAPVRQGEAVKTQRDAPVSPSPGRAEERGVQSSPAEGRRDAEQAGAQVASARRAAERAGAPFYASKMLANAQAKETEGAAALRRSEYGSAIRLLAEARSDYQAAEQEARREADKEHQIAPLRASVEQARDTALTRRGQALAADAARLATDLLHAAETKHAEGDSLAARQSFAAAARAYDEAAERYAEAARRAQAASSGK